MMAFLKTFTAGKNLGKDGIVIDGYQCMITWEFIIMFTCVPRLLKLKSSKVLCFILELNEAFSKHAKAALFR